ncbi:hypothetical protein VQH23_26485 (plasmid) [Pararoseomonas sp. SCSIO 73927]|uniref:hypothetical protein n=1 Tax=Pararoseomonas sp. SCSIO 73927 TaxID=3114537 RepID=UPI0030CE59F7
MTHDDLIDGIIDAHHGQALAAFTKELFDRSPAERPAYEEAFRQAFTPWFYEAWQFWRRRRGYL